MKEAPCHPETPPPSSGHHQFNDKTTPFNEKRSSVYTTGATSAPSPSLSLMAGFPPRAATGNPAEDRGAPGPPAAAISSSMTLRSSWPETVSSSGNTVKSHFKFHPHSTRLSLFCIISKQAS